MKRVKKVLLAFALVMIGTSLLFSSCSKSTTDDQTSYLKSSQVAIEDESFLQDCICNPADTIYPFEIEMLQFMREEEKLAHDVYVTLYGQFNVPVFNNISKSEQIHMDRVLYLLNYYNIPDPALPGIGEFSNPDLEALYNALVEQGSASLVDALTVGATIEDLDISDLNQHIGETENEAIQLIFGHLRCGSTNHLKAFTNLLNFHNAPYTPQYISQEEFDEILNGTFSECMTAVGFPTSYAE